jgi:hypothetical protein
MKKLRFVPSLEAHPCRCKVALTKNCSRAPMMPPIEGHEQHGGGQLWGRAMPVVPRRVGKENWITRYPPGKLELTDDDTFPPLGTSSPRHWRIERFDDCSPVHGVRGLCYAFEDV